MKWNNLLLSFILGFNLIISQANYQILTIPNNFHDIFKTTKLNNPKKLSIFYSSFPAQIDFSSLNVPFPKNKKASLTFNHLDYGTLIDINDNNIFHASESVFKINYRTQLNPQMDITYSMGYLISLIDNYSSDLIFGDLILAYQHKKNQFIISMKNLGHVLNQYTSTNINSPVILRLQFLKLFNGFDIQLNYLNRLDIDFTEYSFSTKINFTKKIKLYGSVNNNRSDLLYGDYITQLFVSTSFGLEYYSKKDIIGFAFQNLGAAGYSTSIFFSKVIE